MSDNLKPLFLPLKKEYFEAFENGSKLWEVRREGGSWQKKHLISGREIVLSCGYGKQRRLRWVIGNVCRALCAPNLFDQVYFKHILPMCRNEDDAIDVVNSMCGKDVSLIAFRIYTHEELND